MKKLAKGSSALFFFFFILVSFSLIHLISLCVAQPQLDFSFNLNENCYDDHGNYTNNTEYRDNLDKVLSSISSNKAIDYGFYYESFGLPNQVFATVLCRGDVSVDVCRDCVSYSAQNILQVCPISKKAIGASDYCKLRYSDEAILGIMETFPTRIHSDPHEFVGNATEYNVALKGLLNRVILTAASGNYLRKFATGETTVSSQEIYALVQCSPDLSEFDCLNCLSDAYQQIPECCENKMRVRIIEPSCSMMYDNRRFYNSTPNSLPPSPSVSPPTKEENDSNTVGTRTLLAIIVPVVSIVILIICITIFLRPRKLNKKADSEAKDEIIKAESLQFDFNTVRVATDNFSDANKLGQGGFGFVYKGRLYNGQDVAVKRLSMHSGQGDLEFKNEVLLVAKLQHRSLVRLLGFSLEGNERLLIYEFVPNTSLDNFLFDAAKRSQLDWETRFNIIGGIARGLLYLHKDSRLRIIHRDLKASNILLDAKMNSKIADFGMARLFEHDETHAITNRIVGTYGYMAPEYAMHGQFSDKSDVYSFGVLILEILSGQRNNCFRSGENVEDLLSFTWKNWTEGTVLNMIDPTLSNGSQKEMIRCIHIGLLCVQENAEDRPTMASIVLMLNNDSLTLPIPLEPTSYVRSAVPDIPSLSCSSSGVPGYDQPMTDTGEKL